MKKADNFNPGKWLVENKITFQSRLNENINFPEMEDEFRGAMETGDQTKEEYLQDIINTPSSQVDLSGYYEVENAIEQGDYSKEQAIKLMKAWAKEKLGSRLNEDKQELLDFVKANSKEIAQAVGATNLKNISSDSMGDISATPLFSDYEMVTTSSAPKATITLNGETFSIQDIISNPSMFLNKKVIFQRSDDYNPEKRTIGTIEDDRIGFNERSKSMGSNISFSENPLTDGDTSGNVEVGGKTIYYTMYNV